MASLINHSFFERLGRGAGDLQSLTVKCALVTSSYTPNKDHDFFADITNEVSGTGYTAGGNTVAVTVTDDDANDRVDIEFAATQWATATIAARGAQYYVDTGDDATSWLIAFVDFGSNYSSSAGPFDLAASIVRIPT